MRPGTEPDQTVLAGSLIKIFTRRDVRVPEESSRHSVLSIIRCHVPYGIFGIQGVLYGCPLVLARRETGIERMKEVRLVRRRSRCRASRSSVIYTSQRVNVRAFFILFPPPRLNSLTPTVGHPHHFRFLDDCTVTLAPVKLLFGRVGARPCSGPRKSRNLSPVRHNDSTTALIIPHSRHPRKPPCIRSPRVFREAKLSLHVNGYRPSFKIINQTNN